MIDRFTAKARESINLAVQAAEELGHSYVGTEHLLIGLLEEGSGVAARVLSENGVKKEKVHRGCSIPSASVSRSFISTFWPPWVRMRLPTRRNF